MDVYLLTGSNLGNREFYLDFARMELKKAGTILNASAIYESSPWGYRSPYPFLNQCLQMETALSPSELLEFLKSIEKKAGRIKRHEIYEDRCLDIDILIYGSEIISADGLNIPHPRMELRAFVLVPLAEIARDLVHPVLNKTIKQLQEVCPDKDQPKRVGRKEGI